MSARVGPPAFRDASLVLGLINVYQPVSRESLFEKLDEKRRGSLGDALRFLVSQGLVRTLPEDMLRTTWEGQQALSFGVIGRRRDLQRMWHLANLSDECRRQEGENS